MLIVFCWQSFPFLFSHRVLPGTVSTKRRNKEKIGIDTIHIHWHSREKGEGMRRPGKDTGKGECNRNWKPNVVLLYFSFSPPPRSFPFSVVRVAWIFDAFQFPLNQYSFPVSISDVDACLCPCVFSHDLASDAVLQPLVQHSRTLWGSSGPFCLIWHQTRCVCMCVVGCNVANAVREREREGNGSGIAGILLFLSFSLLSPCREDWKGIAFLFCSNCTLRETLFLPQNWRTSKVYSWNPYQLRLLQVLTNWWQRQHFFSFSSFFPSIPFHTRWVFACGAW